MNTEISQKKIFLVGRDNWQNDDSLNHILLNYLQKNNHEIIWEDPAGNIIYKFRKIENRIKWLPNYVRKINLRLLQFGYSLFHWSYFTYLSQRQNISIEIRSKKLRKSILEMGNTDNLIILSRSSGGRISSLIADDLNIKHIICLSYPFKHPKMDNEPDRYLHLKNLKTPMLIIQGEKDEYGGIDIKEKYEFSPNIELSFVDTNHNFSLNNNDWNKVLQKIDEIINQN